MAKYPYVVMVDRDCYLTPNYVKKLLKKMNDDVGAVCGLRIPHPSLSFFWIFKCAVFAIVGLFRRI